MSCSRKFERCAIACWKLGCGTSAQWDVWTGVKEILGDTSLAPLMRLRLYFEELFSLYGPAAAVSGCMLGNLSLEIADRSETIQAVLRQSFLTWQAAIACVLREAIDRGGLTDTSPPHELASFLLNSYEGALLRSKADGPFDRSRTICISSSTICCNVTLRGRLAP